MDDKMIIKPNFCKLNLGNVDRGGVKTLAEESGLDKLEKLYYDDYNFETGKYLGMTDKMRTEVYEKDVETFYKPLETIQCLLIQKIIKLQIFTNIFA